MLSKMITASVSQAAALASGIAKLDSRNAVDTGGLDSAAFMGLHMLALGKTLDELLPEYDPIAQGSHQGPWVFSIPKQLKDHLVSLNPISVEALARNWAMSDELRDDGVEEAEAITILFEVTKLAHSAKSSGTELLLWLSL